MTGSSRYEAVDPSAWLRDLISEAEDVLQPDDVAKFDAFVTASHRFSCLGEKALRLGARHGRTLASLFGSEPTHNRKRRSLRLSRTRIYKAKGVSPRMTSDSRDNGWRTYGQKPLGSIFQNSTSILVSCLRNSHLPGKRALRQIQMAQLFGSMSSKYLRCLVAFLGMLLRMTMVRTAATTVRRKSAGCTEEQGRGSLRRKYESTCIYIYIYIYI